MEQSGPVFSPPAETVKELVAALGIAEADLYDGLLPTIANTGNSFLLIPLASEHILKEIQPDMEKLKQISQTNALIGVYPFALTTDATHAHATARMFGPHYGIDEEAATGMAAGPLACFLYVNQLVRKEQIIIEQGRYMPIPSPSQLIANLSISSDSIASVFVGGSAYVESEMIIHY
jgi:PhzF family phenazine biosynthesis protein